MSRQGRVQRKLLLALLAGRFEPIEFIMALSAAAQGLWLVFPYWETVVSLSTSGAPRWVELFIGGVLAVAGMAHLLGLATGWFKVRRHAAFVKFIMWLFFTGLAVVASGLSSIVWMPFATLAFVSALLYLSLSVGVLDGDE